MRSLLAFITLSFAGLASATTVTFDDVATGIYVPDGQFNPDPVIDTLQGYSFFQIGFPSPIWVSPRVPAGGNYLDQRSNGLTTGMVATDGSLFSLQQLDVQFIDPDNFGGSSYGFFSDDVVIRARDSAGDLIVETTVLHADSLGWRTVTFDSTWTGIASLELGFSVSGPESTSGGYDNIVVTSAVPIPAAVWLFGSALVGLGWLRQKQTS